jgi:anaphase-promoting complex subunit 3
MQLVPVVAACCIWLQEIVPREASVAFMMGRLYKRLGQPDRALAAFNTALDLKPAAADRAAIKAAIDKVCMAEDAEDEEL